jgi:hypothetical protein
MGRLLATVLGLAAVTAPALALAVGARSSTPDSCPVTVPTSAGAFNFGNAQLRAALYWRHGVLIAGTLPGGGAMATVGPRGSVYAKVGWWRGVPGQLVVTGSRLDAPAPPLRADVGTTASYGDTGFVPSGLTFPTAGCWRVVGKVGRATLSLVVEVSKPPEAVVADCANRSEASFPKAFSDPRNLVIGPLVLVGAARAVYTPGRFVGGQKFPALVENGHRVTVELSRGTRRFAALAYGPLPQGELHLRDAHRIVSFVACARGERSGSSAGAHAVTFWSGFVLAASPRCVPLRVWADAERSPRLVELRLGVRRCP